VPDLVGLTIADAPEAWAQIGFAVTDDGFVLGGVTIALAGRGRGVGIVDWTLGAAAAPAVPHPNRAFALDHVVMRTPDFDRTRDELVAEGLDLRRERTDLRDTRMAFFRVGPALLELVSAPGGEAALWGLVAVVPSVDEPAPPLAGRLGAPRDAVQPGRRIAPLRATHGISTAVAFMTPRALR
jgi:hypothetical protein